MKKLIISLYVFFFTGGTYAQERQNTVVAEFDFNKPSHFVFVKPDSIKWRLPVVIADTIRVALLVTHGKVRFAHRHEGYMVIRLKDTVYLDDKKRELKLPVIVWNVKPKKQLP
jgi:hypothetical protein